MANESDEHCLRQLERIRPEAEKLERQEQYPKAVAEWEKFMMYAETLHLHNESVKNLAKTKIRENRAKAIAQEKEEKAKAAAQEKEKIRQKEKEQQMRKEEEGLYSKQTHRESEARAPKRTSSKRGQRSERNRDTERHFQEGRKDLGHRRRESSPALGRVGNNPSRRTSTSAHDKGQVHNGRDYRSDYGSLSTSSQADEDDEEFMLPAPQRTNSLNRYPSCPDLAQSPPQRPPKPAPYTQEQHYEENRYQPFPLPYPPHNEQSSHHTPQPTQAQGGLYPGSFGRSRSKSNPQKPDFGPYHNPDSDTGNAPEVFASSETWEECSSATDGEMNVPGQFPLENVSRQPRNPHATGFEAYQQNQWSSTSFQSRSQGHRLPSRPTPIRAPDPPRIEREGRTSEQLSPTIRITEAEARGKATERSVANELRRKTSTKSRGAKREKSPRPPSPSVESAPASPDFAMSKLPADGPITMDDNPDWVPKKPAAGRRTAGQTIDPTVRPQKAELGEIKTPKSATTSQPSTLSLLSVCRNSKEAQDLWTIPEPPLQPSKQLHGKAKMEDLEAFEVYMRHWQTYREVCREKVEKFDCLVPGFGKDMATLKEELEAYGHVAWIRKPFEKSVEAALEEHEMEMRLITERVTELRRL